MPFDSIGDCQHSLIAEFKFYQYLTLRINTSHWGVLHITVSEFGDRMDLQFPVYI